MRVPAFLFRHSATLQANLGRSAYGVVFGTPSPVRCWVERSTKRRPDLRSGEVRSEERVVASHTVYFPAGTAVKELDRFTFEGRDCEVVEIRPYEGLTPSHIEAVVQ